MQDNGSGSRDINPIRLLAGILLLYFAWRLLSGVINGESSHVALSIAGVVLFTGCGGGLLVWELRQHRLFLKEKREAPAEESVSPEQTPGEDANASTDSFSNNVSGSVEDITVGTEEKEETASGDGTSVSRERDNSAGQ